MRAGLLAVFACALALPAQAQLAGQPPAGHDPYTDPVVTPPVTTPPWRPIELGKPGHRYPFPVYASKHLQEDDLRGIRRVVIVIHGVTRDANRAYEAVAQLYHANGERAGDTLIVAPKFASAIDAGFGKMPAWRRASWEDGEASMAAKGRPAPVTSFQVLDDLVRELSASDRLPALRELVIAGHSAGGQLVHRYAVLNDIDEPLRRAGLNLSYVVANPSSYLYLSPQRPRATGGGYANYERGICPTYNQYKYGPDQMPRISSETDPLKLSARYLHRNVTYLLGGADNNPEHHYLDKTCGAEAQGATRWARGVGYWRYEAWMAQRHPAWPASRHQAQQVVGVGHSSTAMFASTCGARALLGATSVPLPKGAACLPIEP
ncbi:hypothetical protein [Bordetella genomosp. 1]|uniref:Alpha/beta hydrolase n=1 Tax=Bordetella genomosp. 1 TaxID=1395607 RepID=A0ABX4EVB9_9BORD|nr:hypothetical protein [Bordetella genomosp. 1]OZI58133.1 hypothetical protein CAL27_21680 [Bordetella genomosp. 1]